MARVRTAEQGLCLESEDLDSSWIEPAWLEADLTPSLVDYRTRGFARLPGVATDVALVALRARVDALVSGALDHRPFFFQHDAPTGRHEDAPLGEGWIGPSPAYRKVEKLERDPVFLRWIENPLFERLARAVIGPEVALYRAILMNKAPGSADAPGGTTLPWHQDAGALWGLDRDPELQLWLALDDAPIASGCLAFADGSHLDGLATPLGGLVPPALAEARPSARSPTLVPARAGDLVLIHNLVWHASGRNTTPLPRRGLSVCLMHAATRCTRRRGAPRQFVRLFEAPPR
ncbi:MAG: phytanoyl-CoA dioxygenase family protein [Deltaproteobacteria bacterium]|nr:phytanoyl-CoA dioxygenase family protein [Deltaproteobacteria bacterium]